MYPEENQSDDVMGSPLPSPDKKKFKMKIRGDCFLYTSFYMIKKWFLVLVAVRNMPQFQNSMKQMFRFETKDKWFVIGLICALPVLIPVAGLFLALALLLILLMILTFILAVILLLMLIFVIDLPLLLVLVIQAALFTVTLMDLDDVTSVDFTSYLLYIQIAFLCVLCYNAIDEVGCASDNILFMVSHYKKKRDMNKFYGLFIAISILPQILQIFIAGTISYFSPQVILSSGEIIQAIRNFAGLYIIIKANAFMTTFLRETKWHNLHWVLFKYLEENKKVDLIHVQADEVYDKIYKLKAEKIYRYKGWGLRYDEDYDEEVALFVFKWIIKAAIFAIFVGVFAMILVNYYDM